MFPWRGSKWVEATTLWRALPEGLGRQSAADEGRPSGLHRTGSPKNRRFSGFSRPAPPPRATIFGLASSLVTGIAVALLIRMLHSPQSEPEVGQETARLYGAYHAAVRRWAAKLSRNPMEADDIVQEVFLVVHRRLATLPPLRNPAPWLFRITENVVRHRWRDLKRHRPANDVTLDRLPDETPSPLDDLERRRLYDRLGEALSSLGEADQQLLLLCDVRRLPTSQVTAMTGIKPETLRVRRFRARSQMAKRLREAD